MSYYIPVIFLPVDRHVLPVKLESWLDAEPYLNDWFARRDELGLRTSVSRNWWHQDALGQIVDGLHVTGLDFIRSELACLDGQELETSARALDQVLDAIADGIPDLGPAEVDHGSVWWLPRGVDLEVLAEGKLREAYERAQPTSSVSADKDLGFEAAVGFYSFVKSLRAAVDDALGQNKCLLYIQPARDEI